MSKSEKTASRKRQLEREVERLELVAQLGAIHREAQAKKIARLKMENRNLRKRRGLRFRLKVWLRPRRKK